MIAVAGWGLLRGAILLKDVVKDSVAGKIPAIQFPLEWEKPLGDSALAQLRGQYQFVTDRQLLDPLMDRLRQKSAALGSREFLSFVQPFNELKAALGITAEK
jgi:hypothetical protein